MKENRDDHRRMRLSGTVRYYLCCLLVFVGFGYWMNPGSWTVTVIVCIYWLSVTLIIGIGEHQRDAQTARYKRMIGLYEKQEIQNTARMMAFSQHSTVTASMAEVDAEIRKQTVQLNVLSARSRERAEAELEQVYHDAHPWTRLKRKMWKTDSSA